MNIAESILDKGIDDQLNAAETQRVGEFVDGVETKVEEQISALRLVYGDSVESIAGEAMAEVKGYRQTQLELFDPNFKVKDTEAEGAAAWNEKGGDNSIAVGESAMERIKNERYWDRVAEHELVHQKDQAAEFNLGSISYPDDSEPLEVNPVLVEWHSITKSNQPNSDLTPEYISHKKRGDALVDFLGDEEPLLKALKSGDMQTLQNLIDEKIAEQQVLEGVIQPQRVAA